MYTRRRECPPATQALFHNDGKVKRRKALTWPFQSAESAKLIKQLQDYRDTLASVTAADSLEISAKSHAVVTDSYTKLVLTMTLLKRQYKGS
jgi:hypothetical protein